MERKPMLHLLCGTIASGKSTLAKQLADKPATILISEDEWLNALFSDQMSTLADYVHCSSKLRTIMQPHIVALLHAGTSVVLDFPANTTETREWMRDVIEETGVAHELHFMKTPNEVCLARLKHRNAEGDHFFAPSEEQFWQIAKHFQAPTSEEGFNIVVHDA